MAVTMAEISKLRTMTGAGMMDCKNALTEANGDMERAIELIRKRGQAIAAKRSDREASEGCVLAGVKGNFGAIVALKCETDFVAKNADFIALTQQILDAALANQPANPEALLTLNADGRTIAELVTDRSGITGEKMEIGFYETVTDSSVVEYIHPGNKLATIVAFAEANVNRQVGRDIAMQVAAMNPIALDKDSVPERIVAQELEIGRDKARQEGKPENMLDKIAQGRLNKFFQESTLLAQEFIKDGSKTVAAYAKENLVTPTAFKRVTLNQE
ncbi:MAG: translation elongation factor Ts [Prevotellaceae bacterium]|jgi:elongation factor Ts|nr:translation elongation factor Ts [Prevotellaceae bacterium]